MMSARGCSFALLVMLAACGGSQAPADTTPTSAATAADPARLAALANDPATHDPTAAHGASAPPLLPAAPKPDDPKPSAAEDNPTRIGARHVLVQWMGSDRASKSVLRTREQALVLIEEVLKRARAGEDLGRLAVEYSDEPNAGARGGSLGRFTRGQMVAPFEAVVFKLRVGEISDVVETPFGFHVIQRTE